MVNFHDPDVVANDLGTSDLPCEYRLLLKYYSGSYKALACLRWSLCVSLPSSPRQQSPLAGN